MSHDEHEHPCGQGPHLTCREVAEFLLSYLERELDETVLAHFDTHLRMCPPCGAYLASYRETVALVRHCGRAEECEREGKPSWTPPPEDLVQAILRAKRGE